jgi:hypothetical protein
MRTGTCSPEQWLTNSSRQVAMMWVVLEVGGLDAHWDLQHAAVVELTAADRRQ